MENHIGSPGDIQHGQPKSHCASELTRRSACRDDAMSPLAIKGLVLELEGHLDRMMVPSIAEA